MAAHPRSRGENAPSLTALFCACGSSPLTRGKPSTGRARLLPLRLIPAHAGKTYEQASQPSPHPAHPRSRGENEDECLLPRNMWGSSPLTRGKRRPSIARTSSTGLIPAHAGKTIGLSIDTAYAAAHPRSRGENSAGMSAAASSAGSSPLTRGKPLSQPRAAIMTGLIPAHAGKTLRPLRGLHGMEAHPRSRGENALSCRNRVKTPGSSPLTRGKRDVGGVSAGGGGLIPAHAGKTQT